MHGENRRRAGMRRRLRLGGGGYLAVQRLGAEETAASDNKADGALHLVRVQQRRAALQVPVVAPHRKALKQ